MVGKSTHLQVIPQQSTQNAANLPLQTYEKNSELFLLFNAGADFGLHNNFANSGSFAKVSVPVHIYNSLIQRLCLWELWHPVCVDNGVPQLPKDLSEFLSHVSTQSIKLYSMVW